MKKLITLLTIILLFTLAQSVFAGEWEKSKGTYAVFNTSLGKIVCELYPDKAPETVANFVGLAEGTKEYLDTKTKKFTTGKYYDGTIFHRVIPNFMIQGGDPLGTGRGGPGYKFKNEYHESLDYSQPGMLAMANAGKNTNGSQFFITEVAVPLKAKDYTIFGKVVEGQGIVKKIAYVRSSRSDRPITDVVLEKLEIVRVK